VLLGRFTEKALAGSFWREPLNYLYALDEMPTYATVQAASVAGRFNIQHFAEHRANV
jgi:hypothetical protein